MTNILIWFFLIAQVFFNTLVNHFVNALSFLAVAWHATYDVTPTLHIAQGGTMSRVAVIIEYEVKSEHRSAFEALVREHGTYSLEAEEGCLAFEVMVKKDDPLRNSCSNAMRMKRPLRCITHHPGWPRLGKNSR